MPYGLDCETCPRSNRCDQWGVDGENYRHEGADLFGETWERCPIAYLSAPTIQVALQLFQNNKVAPLHGWPSQWSAWVSETITRLSDTIEERQGYEAEQWQAKTYS